MRSGKRRKETPTNRKREKERRERERERERELEIFSMMRLDSATSSFLALLLIKSYRKKMKAQNSKEKFPIFALKKMFKPFFVSGVFSDNLSARLKKIVGQ